MKVCKHRAQLNYRCCDCGLHRSEWSNQGPATTALVVNRFGLTVRYKAATMPGAPLRDTREQAEADELAYSKGAADA